MDDVSPATQAQTEYEETLSQLPKDDAAALERRRALNRRIFACLVEGEKERGTGGIALVHLVKDTVVYKLVHEIEHEEFRESVEDTLSEEGDQYMFVVEENSARQLHLWKVPRREVANYEMALAQRDVIETLQLREMQKDAEADAKTEGGTVV